MMRETVLCSILLLGPALAVGQPHPDSLSPDSSSLHPSLPALLDDFPTEQESSALIAEQLADLSAHPLNVNEGSASTLALVPKISPSLAHRIVQFREQHGPFTALNELLDVEGMSPSLLSAIHPYLVTGPPTAPSDSSQTVSSLGTMLSGLDLTVIQRYTRRLDSGRGYDDSSNTTSFLGSPGGLTTRLRLRYRQRAELALTLDQDPGEPFRWAPERATYGFDHISGSIVLRDLGPLETLVLGDFTPQFGQGVALWQGMSFGKGRNPVTPLLRSGRGVRPYRSAAEHNFLRGAGATVSLPEQISVSVFASHRRRDASIDSIGTSSEKTNEATTFARTISEGGYHRTPSEIARKGALGETMVGGALEFRRSSVLFGLTGYQSHFDSPLRPGNQPYRLFRTSGRQTSVIGAYTSVYLDSYTVFGELGRSPRNTYGGVAGIALEEKNLQALIQGRLFPVKFASPHGQVLGEGSGSPQNERGFYLGLRMQVASNWRIGAYVDQFRFPWLRFTIPRPSRGWEGRLIVEHDPRPWLSSYLQFRAQSKEEGAQYPGPKNGQLDGVSRVQRHSLRGHSEYSFSEVLALRSRIEMSWHTGRPESSKGILVSQGIRLRPTSSLRIDARLAFFDTDGYEARIYAYEHDLLYSFSVPVFFARGRRSYVLLQYEPFSALVLEAKYGVLRYVNRSTVGSGLNEIDGPRRRELGVQVRWRM